MKVWELFPGFDFVYHHYYSHCSEDFSWKSSFTFGFSQDFGPTRMLKLEEEKIGEKIFKKSGRITIEKKEKKIHLIFWYTGYRGKHVLKYPKMSLNAHNFFHQD